jgi:ribosomal protein S18 acetylase RimI-like enzyme
MSALQVQITRATAADLPAIAELAGRIWRACYPGIISAEQIEYMLGRMYALATLREEISVQGVCFEQLWVNGTRAGFAAYGPTPDPEVLKLHKLYLLPEWQGRGLGSRLLAHCEAAARQLGARRLMLAVNKRNARAIAAYERNGFRRVEAVRSDIGGGFVMDDFIFAKELAG